MNQELIDELNAVLNDDSPYLTTNISKELLNRAICELMQVKSSTDENGWNFPYPKPTEKGVYHVRCHDGDTGYQYWDGEAFNVWNSTPEEALEDYNTAPAYQSRYQDNFWKKIDKQPTGVWCGTCQNHVEGSCGNDCGLDV